MKLNSSGDKKLQICQKKLWDNIKKLKGKTVNKGFALYNDDGNKVSQEEQEGKFLSILKDNISNEKTKYMRFGTLTQGKLVNRNQKQIGLLRHIYK